MVLANSINRPAVKWPMLVRCLKPTSQLLELPVGATIRTITSIDQHDISEGEQSQAGAERYTQQTWEVLKHIEAMFRQTCKVWATKEQKDQLADLFTRYQTVFSQNNQGEGRTEPVHYSIPLLKSTRSTHQLPHRLGQQKG